MQDFPIKQYINYYMSQANPSSTTIIQNNSKYLRQIKTTIQSYQETKDNRLLEAKLHLKFAEQLTQGLLVRGVYQ